MSLKRFYDNFCISHSAIYLHVSQLEKFKKHPDVFNAFKIVVFKNRQIVVAIVDIFWEKKQLF